MLTRNGAAHRLRLQLLKPSELDDYSRIFDNDKVRPTPLRALRPS